jgi:hypothetical protein
MLKEENSLTVLVPGGPAALSPVTFGPGRGRRGQTTIEYLLVTVSLLFVFVLMFKALQYALANQFKRGGTVIIKMYKEDPW